MLMLLKVLLVLMMAIWLVLLVWVHQPMGRIATLIMIGLWVLLTLICLFCLTKPVIIEQFLPKNYPLWGFFMIFCLTMIGFLNLQPSNERQWHDDVAQMLDFSLSDDGKTVTVHQVRNFDWIDETTYHPNWDTRHYQLDELQSIDFIASYWTHESISHTFVSFGFSNGEKLAFSVEIRKERDEEFSSIAGFFRKFEIIIIASDEKDVIYTRSNVRQEDVYIYPLNYDKQSIKQLFMAYLNQAKSLKRQPQWYNTLTNNCTTAIYQLINPITPIPLDYRWLASGYMPEYWHEIGWLDNQYHLSKWRQKAHINPKTKQYSLKNPISSQDFSNIIRQDF